ncbi:MAG TPA: ABC transporter permease [Terriglobales bacterium]|nr:ABC transporter permease [Terriglobales bacterium]
MSVDHPSTASNKDDSRKPAANTERVWEGRSFSWLEDAGRDFRFALRSLAKVPSFAVIAVLVIAVGIGANTAVFSVINTVLLKPLSYPDPQSLVMLMNTGPQGSFPGANVPKFNIWHQQTSIFDAVAAFDEAGAGLNLTGGSDPEQLEAVHVTQDYFRLFGAPILNGRAFTAAEDSPNGGRVTVLSYGLWKRRFGANPGIVGTNIQLDGQPYLVVGVVGPKFETETPTDLWLPYQFDLNSRDMAHYFRVAARLKPGVTVEMANAELKLAADQFRRTYPGGLGPKGSFGVEKLQDVMVGDTRLSLLVLLGAVTFVLLIACANVANLLLIRATARQRELATRAALGADRGHIIRQLLTESLAISLLGGFFGLILGFVGVRLLLAVSPGGIPRIGPDGSAVNLDLNVLLFTFGVSVLTGILFGLFPAIGTSRINLASALKESSSQAGVGLRTGKVRSILVIGEVALALVLVVGAGLLIRTFMKLQAVDPGFDTHNVLTMAMSLSGERFQKTAGVAQIVRDGTERLLNVPGVSTAAAACCLPLEGGFGLPFDIVGRPKGKDPNSGGAGYTPISWSYFDAFKVPIVRGRSFTEHDDGSAPGVVIINEAMAKKFWPNSDPLNDRLLIGANMGPVFGEPARQIVGVAGDMRGNGLDRNPAPTMYIPIAQMPDKVTALNSRITPLWWIVRSPQEPHPLAKAIAIALRDASGGLPIAHIRSMDEIVVTTTSRQRFNMLLLTIFGASALLVAAIGIYGLMAYSVQHRTQELGIRMALGAQTSTIRNMVIRQGMLLAGIGIVIGIAGALWLTHFLASLLFGVKALDLAAFVITLLLLSAVAFVAVWFPARRATKVSPMTALRFE